MDKYRSPPETKDARPTIGANVGGPCNGFGSGSRSVSVSVPFTASGSLSGIGSVTQHGSISSSSLSGYMGIGGSIRW